MNMISNLYKIHHFKCCLEISITQISQLTLWEFSEVLSTHRNFYNGTDVPSIR